MLTALRLAFRRLRQAPGFSALAVFTLALGIGANTAVFSVVNAVLLRPLPYPDPARLVLLRERSAGFELGAVSFPNFQDWREGNRSLTDISLFRRESFNFALTGAADLAPERAAGARVTAEFFAITGLEPQLGRTFTSDEDSANGPRVIVISDAFWRRVFHAAPEAVGRTVKIDGAERTVVGVASAGLMLPRGADIYVPLGEVRGRPNTLNRGAHGGYSVVGRLKPGVTPEQAEADLNLIAAELARRYPETNAGRSARVLPLLEASVGQYRASLFLLVGAVGCVLLIACANVANLQLARATRISRELAVRTALGASRGDILRFLLTESIVLALLGGIGGLLVASWGIELIHWLLPPTPTPLAETRLDWMALVFAAGSSLGTAILIGLWPAWRASNADALSSRLHEGSTRGGSDGPARGRLQGGLVIAQVALALVLLTGAGLMIRSFQRVQEVPLGFDPQGVLMLQLDIAGERYDSDAKATAFFDRLIERVRALPGVTAASIGSNVPFDNTEDDASFHVTATPAAERGREPIAEISMVSPGYFRTLGVPIMRGRGFGPEDTAAGARTIVIDESLAQRHFPGVDPIGRQIDNNQNGGENAPPLTIIGVVPRTRNDSPEDRTEAMQMPQIYYSATQFVPNSVTLLVRTETGDPTALTAALKREIAALDPEQPTGKSAALSASIASSLAPRRLVMSLLGGFAGVALLLSVIGLYGVLSLAVAQRTREFGIRMALGAEARSVLQLVLRRGMLLVGIGLALGLTTSALLARVISRLLFGVGAFDTPTVLGGLLLLVVTGFFACFLPARRATQVDPVTALRAD